MIRYYLLLVFSCLMSLPAVAQTFKGRIVDEKANPVPYVSLYIHELSAGLVSDVDGRFHTTLKTGTYTCEVSCIGYVSQKFPIQVPASGLEKDIVLVERVYELGEVNVNRGGEDPAYAIMRQVIANAPYYRQQVKSYKGGTYLKGTGKVKEIPAILKLSKEVRKESKEIMGKLFVLEEQREVEFVAPNTWKSQVKAYRNSFPESMNAKVGITSFNLYTPTLFGKVSPLAVGAFSYYRFRLDGCYVEGSHVVNKIRVIPKTESPKLLSGYIYIIEDLWCLSSAEISLTGALQATIKATCKEVQPSVFLPTSVSMECKVSVMGLRAEASYLAALHYSALEVNKQLSGTWGTKESTATSRPLTKKQEKIQKQIEELTQKDDLSMRDAYQLSKLLTHSIQEADTLRPEHKFERRTAGSDTSVETDSLAGKRDSLYWAHVRSVPLKPEEIESYKRKELLSKDSLKSHGMSPDGQGEIGVSARPGVAAGILFGHTFRSKDKKNWLQIKGLDAWIPQYNFVDGYWIGPTISVGRRFSPASALHLTSHAYYTTARKTVVGYGDLVLEYAPHRLGKMTVSGGSLSADYNGESGEPLIINTLSTLLFARNDVKFYDKKYISFNNEIEIANSLLFSAGFTWQRRKSLENHRSTSYFGKTGSSNTPGNETFTPMPANELLKASFALEYTPAHYYRMSQGKKVYDSSRWPTFTLGYERAFLQGGEALSPTFHRVEFTARQQVEFGMFNTVQWMLNGGLFHDAENIQFPDYKHFAATRFPLAGRAFSDGFFLLDNYKYSTATRWAQAGITWNTPYLLLKRLPFFRKKAWDESLHLRSLVVYGRDPYTEVGYSVGLVNLMRIGVFAAFERCKYQSVGVSVALTLPK